MNKTLEASEKIAQIYQPNNTIEYVSIMFLLGFLGWLISKYFMKKKESSNKSEKNDYKDESKLIEKVEKLIEKLESSIKEELKENKESIKEDVAEIKEEVKEITKTQIRDGKKISRDFERLEQHDDKFKTLFEFMNENQKDVSEIKGRLA